MNPNSLDNFAEDIRQVLDHIEYIERANELANSHPSFPKDPMDQTRFEHFKYYHINAKINKKIFDYKAIIISLYGLLEKHIEIWIKEFLNIASNIVPNHLLDDAIRKKHFSHSIKLISKIIDDRWDKYRRLTKESVLDVLNNWSNNPTQYKFNVDAFTIQSGNLKHVKIVEMFKDIGINLTDALLKDKNLNLKVDASSDGSLAKKDSSYSKINELVDRRNTIAHGGVVDDLLGYSSLKPYITFLKKYCTAIFAVLCEECLKYESKHEYQKIEVVHNIWKKTIIGVDLENYSIKQGDSLIVQTPDDHFYKKPILELQVNRESHEKLDIVKKSQVCIKIEPQTETESPITTQCSFFIKKPGSFTKIVSKS